MPQKNRVGNDRSERSSIFLESRRPLVEKRPRREVTLRSPPQLEGLIHPPRARGAERDAVGAVTFWLPPGTEHSHAFYGVRNVSVTGVGGIPESVHRDFAATATRSRFLIG